MKCRQKKTETTESSRLAAIKLLVDDLEPQKAFAPLRRMLSKTPDHLPALELLARAQWRSHRPIESLRTLDRLILLNPYEPGYYYLRGLALQSLHRYDDAQEAYERCVNMGESAEREPASLARHAIICASGPTEKVDPLKKLEQNRLVAIQSTGQQDLLISWARPS